MRQACTEVLADAGQEMGKPFETGPGRTLYRDTCAMQAAWHMKTHGTSQLSGGTCRALGGPGLARSDDELAFPALPKHHHTSSH